MQYARQSIAVGLKDDCVYVIGGWNNGPLNYNDNNGHALANGAYLLVITNQGFKQTKKLLLIR